MLRMSVGLPTKMETSHHQPLVSTVSNIVNFVLLQGPNQSSPVHDFIRLNQTQQCVVKALNFNKIHETVFESLCHTIGNVTPRDEK